MPTSVLGRDFLQIPLLQQYLTDLTQRMCYGDSTYWHKLYICLNGNHMVNIFQLIFQGCKNYRGPSIRALVLHSPHSACHSINIRIIQIQLKDPFHFPPQALNSKQPPSIRNYLFSLNFEEFFFAKKYIFIFISLQP